MLPRTLRGKFTLLVVGLAMLALLVGLAGIWNLFRLEQSVDNLMTENYKSIDAVYRMMESLERQDSGMLICMSVDRGTGLEIFTQNGNEFVKWFGIEQGNVTETGEFEVINQIKQNYAGYQKMIFDIQGKLDSGGADIKSYYSETVLPVVNDIKSECKQLVAINERAMFASKQNAAESGRRSMLYLVLISMAAATFGYLIARYFILRFLSPIRKLSDSIVRVREGDLFQHVDVKSNDEAGKLASEFNSMTRRLQDYEQSNIGTLLAEKGKSLAIIRSISDPLLVLDANWRILQINDACARFFGLDIDHVAGRHLLEAIPNGELFSDIEKLSSSAEETKGKIIRIRKDGDYYFNLAVTRVNDRGIRNIGVIAALQNVTGLKELDRVKTDFLAAISHEFKTPLTSIMMAASMLREGSMGELTADQAETMETIRMDGDRLLGLVNELLELMKIESGKEIYRIEPSDVNAIALDTAGDHMDGARRKGVRLVTELCPDLPHAAADPGKIRWVLNNLIGNALSHTGSGGEVTVSTDLEGRFVAVSVRDTGTGIPAEYQQKIFDRFVQVKGEAGESGGTGLGLSVAREIVQSHGGDIRVESRLGEGSTFTFTLPVAESDGPG